MKRNTASQVIGAQMVSATDGSAFSGAVTVSVTGDGGTQATGSVGSGACTHEGNGFHTYVPAQAETDYDHVAFTFTGSGAVPATVQVFTSSPQTGDAFARLGAPAGASVSADVAAVKAETATIVADTNELQTDWANGGRLDLILDARASQVSVDTIDGIVDAILVDTAEIGLAGAGLTVLATAAALATVDTVVDSILVDTAEIGTAGAGLTALASAANLATVQTSVDDLPTNAELATALGTADDAVLAQVALVKAKTDSLTFTVAGQVDANVTSISSSTAAADNLEESTEVIGTGTCTTGGSTTSVVASAVSPASAVNDQFNGRVIIFKGNVTAALAGQATTISDYVHATLTFTVVALTTAPASGDLFTIL